MMIVDKIKYILKNPIYKDTFWALLGSVALRGSALITSILLALVLQKNTYGEFNSLKNTLQTLAIFSTFGLGYTSTKFLAKAISTNLNFKDLVKKVYLIALLFSIIISLLLIFFAKDVSLYYYNTPNFIKEIRLLAVWLILTSVATAQTGIISGLGIFKKLSHINIIVGLLTITISICFSYYWGLYGACIALLVIQGLNCLINEYYIRKEVTVGESSLVRDETSIREIVLYSVPLTLIEGVYSLGLWINYYILQHYQGYDEVAVYSIAMQWYILLLFIPMVLRNVILSYFSKVEKGSNNILKNSLMIAIITTSIPAIIVLIFAPFFASFYGKGYVGLITLLRLVVFIPIFSSIINILEQFLFSVSKNWIVFYLCILKDVGTCFLFFFFIKYGAVNGAFYLILSYLIMTIAAFTIYLILYFKSNIFNSLKSV